MYIRPLTALRLRPDRSGLCHFFVLSLAGIGKIIIQIKSHKLKCKVVELAMAVSLELFYTVGWPSTSNGR